MKQSVIYLLIVVFFLKSCEQKKEIAPDKEKKLVAKDILDMSITFHDPEDKFKVSKLDIHLQEPRIQNPYRFSKLTIDNKKNTFKLLRNRGKRFVEYSKNSYGNLQVLLDGKVEKDTSIIRQFRLDTTYVTGYKNYYDMIVGLPMSLKSNMKFMERVENVKFNNHDCYKLEFVLNKNIISKKWVVYFAINDFSVQGLEIINEEEPKKGERMIFQDLMEINTIKYPKIRHWRDRQTNDYLATDILLFNSDILIEEPWETNE